MTGKWNIEGTGWIDELLEFDNVVLFVGENSNSGLRVLGHGYITNTNFDPIMTYIWSYD